MKKLIRQILDTIAKSSFITSCNMLRECHKYYKHLRKYNASINTDKCKNKMQYTLLRENHVIEKGMSMRNPRLGFGQAKVIALLKRLEKYYLIYGDDSFLIYPLSTIKEYIDYTKKNGVDIPEIEKLFDNFMNKNSVEMSALSVSAGIKSVSKEDIFRKCSADYQGLLYNRHSIRYFTDNIPERSIIDKALEMAQRTPSACNRQAWKTHVYCGEMSHKLLDMQGGCGGFTTDIHCSIVVTANMNGFLSYEPFQQYVDGGLYAMNLINSLQALGLGTIPLSCGFYDKKLSKIKKSMNIPDNETLIVIIGVGELLSNFNVAVSTRKSISLTNTYHN